jgi:hypothetical protein
MLTIPGEHKQGEHHVYTDHQWLCGNHSPFVKPSLTEK